MSMQTGVMRGIAWMVLGMSCIGMVDALAKYLGARLPGLEVAWGYFVAMLINLCIWAKVRGIPQRQLWHSTRPWLQSARALCLVGSLACLFSALRVLPLAEATIISFTAPLFVVALAGPMLGEPVGWRRWAAVLAGLVGAMLVIRPGTDLFQWAALLPLFGAVFFALFSLITRLLGPADPPTTTLFYTTFVGAVALTLMAAAVWITPNGQELGWFWLSGALGVIAHLALVQAMLHADASIVAPLNYVRLIWAISIGIVVFGDWPTAGELVGGAVIVASGLYVVFSAARARL